VKILSLGVTQHFTDDVNWVLDLAISTRLPHSMMIVILTTLLVAEM
jgi:hypothetical protein